MVVVQLYTPQEEELGQEASMVARAVVDDEAAVRKCREWTREVRIRSRRAWTATMAGGAGGAVRSGRGTQQEAMVAEVAGREPVRRGAA